MIDKDFCEFLESKLQEAFANSNNEKIKHFWCDGILLPTFEKDYSKKFVNANKKIVTTAFIGLNGQDKYELTLNFGNKALSRYARDLDIRQCLEITEFRKCFEIDTEKQKIEINLG